MNRSDLNFPIMVATYWIGQRDKIKKLSSFTDDELVVTCGGDQYQGGDEEE